MGAATVRKMCMDRVTITLEHVPNILTYLKGNGPCGLAVIKDPMKFLADGTHIDWATCIDEEKFLSSCNDLDIELPELKSDNEYIVYVQIACKQFHSLSVIILNCR